MTIERSPQDWLEYLSKKLDAKLDDIQLYERYYAGNGELGFATQKFKEAFGGLFRSFSDNWCGLVVDTSVNRLAVEGFRLGDEDADKAAWNIWEQNNLSAASVLCHTEASKNGSCYVLVDPYRGSTSAPRITVEHPATCIVDADPSDSRVRRAGLRKWRDGDYVVAVVYLPDGVYRFIAESKEGSAGKPRWQEADPYYVPNPLKVVPIIEFQNSPSLLTGGVSDLKVAIPLQKAIDKTVMDMMVASEYAAYPQRVFTGMEVPKDANGNPERSAELTAAIGRVWFAENKDAKVQQFQAADLSNYTTAISTLVNHLAAQTSTPPNLISGMLVNVSADAVAAAEIGSVMKAKRKQLGFGDAWEQVLSLAFLAIGDTERASQQMSTIWADPQLRSPAQVTDAIVKMVAGAAYPIEFAWADYGLDPQQIERAKTLVNLPARQSIATSPVTDQPDNLEPSVQVPDSEPQV